MAVTYVGVGATGKYGTGNLSGSYAPTDGGAAVGDLMITAFEYAAINFGAWNLVSGWTELAHLASGAATTDAAGAISYRFKEVGDATSWNQAGDTGDHNHATIIALSGVNPHRPFEAIIPYSFDTAGSPTNFTIPAGTVVDANSMVCLVLFAGQAHGTTGYTNATLTVTERFDQTTSHGNDGAIALATAPANAGSTDTTDITTAGGSGKVGALLVINPLYTSSPNFETRPVDVATGVGETVAFTVLAHESVGGGSVTYQWYEVGVGALSGETAATLSITTVLADNGRQFYCDATDTNGTTSSGVATLSVTNQPLIDVEPQDTLGFFGRIGAVFSVTSTLNTPLTYQWYNASDDSAIVGETSATYTREVVPSDNGLGFYCIVSNANGSVQSADAFILDVVTPDNVLLDPDKVLYDKSLWNEIDAGATYRLSPAYNFLNRGNWAGGSADAWSQFNQFGKYLKGYDLLFQSYTISAFTDSDDGYTYYNFFEDDEITAAGTQVQWNTGEPASLESINYAEALVAANSQAANAEKWQVITVDDRNVGTSNNSSVPWVRVVVDPDNFVGYCGFDGFDPCWEYVEFIYTMDGVHGATSITNAAAHGTTTFTLEGTAALDNTQAPFLNTTSLRLNGDGGLLSTNAPMWPGGWAGADTLNAGMTIEMWFYPDASAGWNTTWIPLMSVGSWGSNNSRFLLRLYNDGSIRMYFSNQAGSVIEDRYTPVGQVTLEAWNYVRLYMGNPYSLQVNDNDPIAMWWQNNPTSMPIGDGFRIGRERAGATEEFFEGWIGPVRLTGNVREIGHHPVPTDNFPTDGNDPLYDTYVLSHITGDGVDSVTTIDDEKAVTWTSTNTDYTNADSVYQATSVEMVNGYLETTDLPELIFGTTQKGYLTLSAWFYIADYTAVTPLFFMGDPSSDSGRFQGAIDNGSLSIYLANAGGTAIRAGGFAARPITSNGWHYIEVVIIGDKVHGTVNGQYIDEPGQITGAMSYAGTADVFRLGFCRNAGAGVNLTGKVEDFRLTYGAGTESSLSEHAARFNQRYFRQTAPLTSLPTTSGGEVTGPTINTQPANTNVTDQQVATFTVVATAGAGVLSYQWYDSDNTLLVGETNATLDFTAEWEDNGKGYYCVVTDSLGFVISNTAYMTVVPITLAFSVQPSSQTKDDLLTATFSVTATGRGPFTYQWYTDDDAAIPGEVSDTLVVDVDYFVNHLEGYYCIVGDYYE